MFCIEGMEYEKMSDLKIKETIQATEQVLCGRLKSRLIKSWEHSIKR